MSSIIFNKNMQTSTDVQEALKNLANKVDKSSTEALVNISTLQNLDNETKQNIQQGSELNSNLEGNISSGNTLNNNLTNNIRNANTTNTNLVNNSNLATSKNAELQQSLDETKKYIDSLDGSQNLPQMRSDITDLQNGMKNNQSISYEGASLTCNDTLNGRTEEMVIRGQTLQNLINMSSAFISTTQNILICNKWEFTIGTTISKFTIYNLCNNPIKFQTSKLDGSYNRSINVNPNSYIKIDLSSSEVPRDVIALDGWEVNPTELEKFKKGVLIFSGDVEGDIKYFEGIKSVGDLNNNKVNILSSNTDKTIQDKKEILLPIENGLKGLSSEVCDKIYEKDGKVILEQNIGKIVLDGSRVWSGGVSTQNPQYFYSHTTTLDNYIASNSSGISLCDKLITVNYIGSTSDFSNNAISVGCSASAKIRYYININELTTPTPDGFKKWLQENPITVYCQLAEPIYHDITNLVDIDLDTYDGLTYINSENGIKPILDFKVPSNLASIVQSNSKAINELYELIDKLLIPNITNNTMNIALK